MVFTGIVQAMGTATWGLNGKPGRLRIQTTDNFFERVAIGGSVSVSGVCLTAVELPSPNECHFDVMEETLRLVCLSSEKQNLELPMALGDPVGGHTVTGHVDTTAIVTKVDTRQDGSRDVWFRVDKKPQYRSLVVYKGSIGLHGTSLTIASLEDENSHIRVSLIPHTLAVTTLGLVKEGDRLNIEFDQALKIAKETSRINQPTERNSEVYRYTDEDWMERALHMSLLGQYTASPNPIVGCVIVDPYLGRELGVGFHLCPGTAHAEVVATEDAISRGETVEGSTLYTTLEPCSHTGRTSPCADFIIGKKFARVVIGVVDVDVRVAGKGILALREAGISVTVGTLKDRIENSPLRSFLMHRALQRPFVTVKVASSIDGSTACVDGTSQWITGPIAREDVQYLRLQTDAIVIGSKTLMYDHPRLTVRDADTRLRNALLQTHESIEDSKLETIVRAYRPPARIVFDTTGEYVSSLLTPPGSVVSKDDTIPSLVEPIFQEETDTLSGVAPITYVVMVQGRCQEKTRNQLTSLKSLQRKDPANHSQPENLLRLIEVEADGNGRPCILAALRELAKEGIMQLIVEGGSTLTKSVFEANVVDEIVMYMGAALLGAGSLSWGQSLPMLAPSIQQAKRLKLIEPPLVLENDIRLRYRLLS